MKEQEAEFKKLFENRGFPGTEYNPGSGLEFIEMFLTIG